MAGFHEKSKIQITCPKAIPPFLRQEVEALGFPVLSEMTAGVETEGSLADTMRLNLMLRTGHRVLYLLKEFRAAGPDDLYRETAGLPWEEYISPDGYLSVSSSVFNEAIRDTRFANMKCKDAIVDRILKRKGRRPDSGPLMTGAAVFLRWQGDQCAVYLNTSGEPLSKRGYRKIPLKAPMQETLAAAVIMATGWNDSGRFINPMCGSGTLAIEAALAGLNKAPGLLRKNFGFMHIRGFDTNAWQDLRRKAENKQKGNLTAKIIAGDIKNDAVRAARKNALAAGVGDHIEFTACDFRKTSIPKGDGVVILNPEYGERLGKDSPLEETYRAIGDFFKQRCGGYTGYVFTGNPGLAKKIGLRTKRRIPFFNSKIECRLLEYELYEGSRKIKGGSA